VHDLILLVSTIRPFDDVGGFSSTASKRKNVSAESATGVRTSMQKFIRIGVDLAKNYFQVHVLIE
jgi:hypothetical protein